MAKASVTNIRPPSKTVAWTPSKSSWDLNLAADQDSFYAANVLTDGDASTVNNTRFDALLSQVNFSGTGLTTDALHSYDYVFLGVNGGVDETVVGAANKSGIIVSGNGKDNITGGNLDDLILTGNGKDIVNGGAGNDIILGENGDDTLSGGANNDDILGGAGSDVIAGGTDDAAAPWNLVLHTGETTTVNVLDKDIAWLATPPADGSTAEGKGSLQKDGDYTDANGSLHKEGSYLDAQGNIHQLWSFDSADMPTYDALNSVTFTVAVYKGGLASANLLGKVGTFSGMENQKVFFSIDLGQDGATSLFSDGNHVAVFEGDLDAAALAAISDPQQANLKTQGFDGLSSYYQSYEVAGEDWSEWVFNYGMEAGDILTGGTELDTFVYAAGDGVDAITDYTRAEGDVLKLVGIAQDAVEVRSHEGDSFVVFKNGADYDHNSAIKIVGVADFSVDEILFQAV